MSQWDTTWEDDPISIACGVLQTAREVGFIHREDVIKHQWKMKSTREKWRKGKGYDFLLLAHEHLFVFRKLEEDEKPRPFKDSVKWW